MDSNDEACGGITCSQDVLEKKGGKKNFQKSRKKKRDSPGELANFTERGNCGIR